MIITTPDKIDGICDTVIKEFDIKILGLHFEKNEENKLMKAKNRKG